MKDTKSFGVLIAQRFLLATAILTAILLLVIYGVVRFTVFYALDQNLTAEANEIANNTAVFDSTIIFANPREWDEDEHDEVEVNPTFVQVVSPAGKNLRRSPNLKGHDLDFHPNHTGNHFYNTSLSGTAVREAQVPITTSKGKIQAYAIVALPLSDSRLVLWNLRLVLLITFPLVLLVLYFITRILANRSIQPVRQLMEDTTHISRFNLSRRVSLPQEKNEIYQLAETVNALLNRLEDAVLREKQFTSDASHELRTPLSVMRGSLEVLIRKPRSRGDYETGVQEAISEVDHMSQLIEQLLLLARYESSKNAQKPVPLHLEHFIRDMAKRALNENDLSTHNTFEYHFPGTFIIDADENMFEIVISNLLSNAIKYSDKEAPIVLSAQNKGEKVILTIKDRGRGMTEDEISRIFERFYRTEPSREARIPGHGLGLAIVKRLCELMDIQLKIESSPGNGTSIHLVLKKVLEDVEPTE